MKILASCFLGIIFQPWNKDPDWLNNQDFMESKSFFYWLSWFNAETWNNRKCVGHLRDTRCTHPKTNHQRKIFFSMVCFRASLASVGILHLHGFFSLNFDKLLILPGFGDWGKSDWTCWTGAESKFWTGEVFQDLDLLISLLPRLMSNYNQ